VVYIINDNDYYNTYQLNLQRAFGRTNCEYNSQSPRRS